MTALCAGLPLDWWTTGDPGNRLAATICRRCPGCPVDDPAPHGVIRGGVAYSDAGSALPPCSACGGPNSTFTGGNASVKVCSGCAVPDVWTPPRHGLRHRWIAALAGRGLTAAEVAAEAEVSRSTVQKVLVAARNAGKVAA